MLYAIPVWLVWKLVKWLTRYFETRRTAAVLTKVVQDSEPGAEDVRNAFTENRHYSNLILYSGHNTTFTEIDEVIVSPYGIFCIEEKGHQGYIFGDSDKKSWTQCRYDGKRSLYNPLWQNYKHVKSLELLLGRSLKEPIHSLVVFTNAKLVQVDNLRVLKGEEMLANKLREYNKRVYSGEEYSRICHVLDYAATISPGRSERHVSELKQYLAVVRA